MGKQHPIIALVLRLLGCTLLLTGCTTWIAPRAPAVLDKTPDYKVYSRTQYNTDRQAYEEAVLHATSQKTPEQLQVATYYRDKMLWSIMSDVNESYYRFRNHFHASRATVKTLADMAKLGMSAASTVIGGSAVLSGAVTALQGSQLSFEKNFLEEKATEAILTTMDALREKQRTEIQRKLQLSAPAYSFEEAYNDALAYFIAGSIPSALQGIASEAGRQHGEAKAEAERVTLLRVERTLPATTIATVESKRKLSQILADLIQKNDVEALRKILIARSAPVAPDTLPAELFEQIRVELRKTSTPDEVQQMVNQLKALGLWKD